MDMRFLFCFLFLLHLSVSAEDKRPNIIFLLSDDQAVRTMGCYGAPGVQTPHLDRLGADGMIFDAHYDTTAICMASRANVMTGMFEYKTGCNFEHGTMLEGHWRRSYPVLLRQVGYRTAFAGKFGFEVSKQPGGKDKWLPASDFDRWGGGPGQTSFVTSKNASMKAYAKKWPHATLSYGAFAQDFIRDMAKDAKQGKAPFCLSISFKAPHRPVDPDPKFDHVYAGKKFPKPANYGRAAGKHFSKQSTMGRQYERFGSWDYDKNYDGVMAKYHQQIYAIDVAVGMIRDALNEHGVADNTVIIYTSDNGFLCGSHGYGSKVLPYEEASRVPLLMFDPRHANSGKRLRCASLTGNVDFAPTLLELAGLPVPQNMDGRSLLKLYNDPKSETHQSLPLINVWGPKAVHSYAVVTKDWKYIYWPYAEDELEAADELYHLAEDRLELNNVLRDSDAREALVEMRKTYDAAVTAWKKESVPYHSYKQYGTIFDRHVKWAEKREVFLGLQK
tara:strand:- start:1137 stop:2642 length:1506 start_codon:yes stop_codon:yes gene_type:complete